VVRLGHAHARDGRRTFLSQSSSARPTRSGSCSPGQADLIRDCSSQPRKVFRFLTKPCNPQIFLSAIQAAAAKHRLITASGSLLEKTLRGSIRRSLRFCRSTNPLASTGNAAQTTRSGSGGQFGEPLSCSFEVAAMLYRFGVSLSGGNQ